VQLHLDGESLGLVRDDEESPLGRCEGTIVEFQILGPFEVIDDGEPISLGPVQRRALLAVLVLHRGEPVSTDRLIDQLWGERAPARAAKTVQVYVSHLRKALGAGVIVTEGRGYRLAV
jgi:DNA-binding SARP family transcriptional activator